MSCIFPCVTNWRGRHFALTNRDPKNDTKCFTKTNQKTGLELTISLVMGVARIFPTRGWVPRHERAKFSKRRTVFFIHRSLRLVTDLTYFPDGGGDIKWIESLWSQSNEVGLLRPNHRFITSYQQLWGVVEWWLERMSGALKIMRSRQTRSRFWMPPSRPSSQRQIFAFLRAKGNVRRERNWPPHLNMLYARIISL